MGVVRGGGIDHSPESDFLTEMQKYENAEMQKYRNAEMQKYENAEIQKNEKWNFEIFYSPFL